VVVINFVNRKNAADQRVYELLDQKLNLFEGVFGASDEVLSSIESGVDFEKRIASIYQSCRTEDEINAAFDALQEEKVRVQRSIKDMEKKRNEMPMKLYEAQDEVDKRKEELIDQVEAQLKQKSKLEPLFTIQWSIV